MKEGSCDGLRWLYVCRVRDRRVDPERACSRPTGTVSLDPEPMQDNSLRSNPPSTSTARCVRLSRWNLVIGRGRKTRQRMTVDLTTNPHGPCMEAGEEAGLHGCLRMRDASVRGWDSGLVQERPCSMDGGMVQERLCSMDGQSFFYNPCMRYNCRKGTDCGRIRYQHTSFSCAGGTMRGKV